MAEKEGLVRLRLIASDQPAAAPSPVAFAPSVEQVLIPCSGYAGYCVGLRPMAEKEGFEPPVPDHGKPDNHCDCSCGKCENTQLDSQSSDALSPDMAELARIWDDLPDNIRGAIKAMITPYS
jgi:hypothetical protein